ncbi:hypothetical protein L1887_45278 [Cichorium endivia]|nr:hypothetical protein L1887_45278 [Cichorium endivia]
MGNVANLCQHDAGQETGERGGDFAREGVAGIHRPFGADAGFPLAVIDGIRHQRPVQAVHKRGAEKGHAGKQHEQQRAGPPEEVQYVAHRPQRQTAEINRLLAKTLHRAGHQKHANQNAAHAEKAHPRQQMQIVQHVLSVIDLNRQLDVEGGEGTQVGDAQHQQRWIAENRAERFQNAGLMVVGRELHVAFFHAAVAPPHAEQAAGDEHQRGHQIAEGRLADKHRLYRHKADGAEQQSDRCATLAPRRKLRALVRVFGDGWHHCTVGAVHQAITEAEHHEEHGGEGRFHRQAKVIGHKLRRGDQRHRDGGIKNEWPKLPPRADITPGVEQHAGQHVGQRGKELSHQENNAAIERRHAQLIGVKL